MIKALLAMSRIPAYGLQMAGRDGANPNVGPRRWNDEVSDAIQSPRIANRFALGIVIAKRFPPSPPHNSWLSIGNIFQTGFASHSARAAYRSAPVCVSSVSDEALVSFADQTGMAGRSETHVSEIKSAARRGTPLMFV
jgi:hypothetical protein